MNTPPGLTLNPTSRSPQPSSELSVEGDHKVNSVRAQRGERGASDELIHPPLTLAQRAEVGGLGGGNKRVVVGDLLGVHKAPTELRETA